MGNLELPVPTWQDDGTDTPADQLAPAAGTPWSPDGLLGGLDLSNRGGGAGSLALLMDPKDIASISGLPAAASGAGTSGGPAIAPTPYLHIAKAYDGICKMPDGSVHPYIDTGDGYGNVYGAGNLDTNGQFGIGAAGNGTAAPVSPKRGGVGGGGESGNTTSPASRVARGLTDSARFGPLRPITGTGSIGGSIGKAIPFLGGPLMWLDVLEHQTAPNCTPIPDPTAIY